MSTPRSRPVLRSTALLVSLLFTLTACGTRLDKTEVLQGAGLSVAGPASVAPSVDSSNQAAAALEPAPSLPAPGSPGDPGAAAAPWATGPSTGAAAPSAGQPRASAPGGAGASPTAALNPRQGAAGAPAQGQTQLGRRGAGPAPGSQPAGPAPGPSDAATPGVPAGSGCQPNLPPLVLGNVGWYSGAVGASLVGGSRMIKVWAAWVNSHGCINGQQVRVIVADEEGSTSRALQLVKGMVEGDGVVAFVGNMQPLTVHAVQRYVEEKRVPLVGGDSLAQEWFKSPMLFPSATEFYNQNYGVARKLARKGNLKFGLLYCVEVAEVCDAVRDAFFTQGGAQKAGLQPTYQQAVSLTEPQATLQNYCLQAKNKGVQAFLLAVDSATFSRTANACASIGYQPIWSATGLTLTSDLIKNPNVAGGELIAGANIFPWMYEGPETADYRAAMKQFDPGLAAAGATAAVWASGKLFEKAASKASGTGALTSARLLTGLYSIKGDNLGGLVPPLTYAEGAPAQKNACSFTVAIVAGKWTAPAGLTCD
jgi:branched-chain amino acid transport system substrate-binding protein